TSVQKFSLKELSRNSNAVVIARVASTESRWDGGEIYTYTRVEVVDGLKGAKKGDAIVVRQLGGQVGELASIVPGMPSFHSGEEVVLFLSRKDKAGYPWVMGLEQGKYTISSDGKGSKRVRRSSGGLNLVGSDGKGAPEETSLDVFLDEVRVELGLPATINEAEGVQ
ncbi:MAG TPA: hypothetical protein VFT12_11645, partial [Thermoanaerobaculia bacterium]|nr:hypothetical protein [Thermoanaerobaculia bacterium]